MDFNTLLTAIFTNGIGAACAAAVLWLGWYRETKAVPDMVKTFAETLARVQASYEDRNSKALELFSSMVKEERLIYQKWHDENRQRIDSIIADLKDQRHTLNNLMGQLKLREAVVTATTSQRAPENRS